MGSFLQLVSMETGRPTQATLTEAGVEGDFWSSSSWPLAHRPPARGQWAWLSMCTSVTQTPTLTGELTPGQAQRKLQTLRRSPPLAEESLFFGTTTNTGYRQSFPFLPNWWVKTGKLFWIALLYSWLRLKTFFIWILITCISFVWPAWINPLAVFLLGLLFFYRFEILIRRLIYRLQNRSVVYLVTSWNLVFYQRHLEFLHSKICNSFPSWFWGFVACMGIPSPSYDYKTLSFSYFIGFFSIK